MDPDSIARVATGAASVVTDRDGQVLLVHHTYGHLQWELPGGLGEAGETPAENAARELREETGLIAGRLELVAIYYEAEHGFAGPFLHHLFRCDPADDRAPVPDRDEISEAAYWPPDALPAPMSDFTERRIRDALGSAGEPVLIERVVGRRWRDLRPDSRDPGAEPD